MKYIRLKFNIECISKKEVKKSIYILTSVLFLCKRLHLQNVREECEECKLRIL